MKRFNQKQLQYINKEEMDHEWAELITEALRMGITKEEIRELLLNNDSNLKLDQIAQ